VRTSLTDLLATGRVIVADGATGTNAFTMGLAPGEAPEMWVEQQPEKVKLLHQQFVDAGADIVLTNTFGANRHRLKLHGAQDRAFELNRRAAELAGEVAAAAPRPVVVAGSVGPTGELFVPLGALTEEDAVDAFTEQIAGLKAGGADVAWIETMSAVEEVRAAAMGAIAAGLPYVATCSFDTAGRTMMGLTPGALPAVFDGLPVAPLAFGANCGVGAPDILVSLLAITEQAGDVPVVVKGNCGVPYFAGTEVVYSGTPELMGHYAELAVRAGARIVGGCCGTTPEHLVAIRRTIDALAAAPHGGRPDIDTIVTMVGPLANSAPTNDVPGSQRARSRRRTAT
jgi:5-methyltetrahydrofolate--homocysteine methyltransferase